MGVDNITPRMLTEMRRTIDDVIPKSQFVDPSTRNVAIRLRKILNDVVQESVDSKLLGKGKGGALKSIGNELSKYYDFLEMAEKQSNLGRGTLMANLTRLGSTGIGGTIGASVGGVPGAVVGGMSGVGIETMLRDPDVLYRIYKVAKIAQKAGIKLTQADLLKILGQGAVKTLTPATGVTIGELTK
jgi:hypothetical protein